MTGRFRTIGALSFLTVLLATGVLLRLVFQENVNQRLSKSDINFESKTILLPSEEVVVQIRIDSPLATADVAVRDKSCSCLNVELSDLRIDSGKAIVAKVGLHAPNTSGTFSAHFDVVFEGAYTHVTRVVVKYKTLRRFEFEGDYNRIYLGTSEKQTLKQPLGIILVQRANLEQSSRLQAEASAIFVDTELCLQQLSREVDDGITVTRFLIPFSELARATSDRPFQGVLTARSGELAILERIQLLDSSSLSASPTSLYLSSNGIRSEVRVVISAKMPFEIVEVMCPEDLLTATWVRKKATAHVCIIRPSGHEMSSPAHNTKLRVVADSGTELEIPVLLLPRAK